MSRPSAAAAALALAAWLGPAGAQEAADHPLAGAERAPLPPAPVWAGGFEGEGLAVWLHPAGDGVRGHLQVGDRYYRLEGAVERPERVAGEIVAGAARFPFSLELADSPDAVLVAGDRAVPLDRRWALAGEARGRTALPPGRPLSVHVGQRYRYALQAGGQQVYTVEDVSGDEITYATQLMADLGAGEAEAVGEPSRQVWRAPAVGPDGALPGWDDEVTWETVEVAGRRIPCMVSTAARTKAWFAVAAAGEAGVVFPGIVRLESDGEVMMELVAIED